jgi:ribosomal protein S18 acetylase RimI-like enzyme
MQTSSIRSDADIAAMKSLVHFLGQLASVTDFEELILMDSVRAVTRLWWEEDTLAAFAYIDDYNNLYFEYEPSLFTEDLGGEIVAWGVECMQARNKENESNDTLDASCSANDKLHLPLFLEHGFEQTPIRSLGYKRSASLPIPEALLPQGFSIRSISRDEVEQAVALHRAAFGTEHMTVERRLAIMDAPDYLPDLDLVVVAPDGTLAAFCICGMEEVDGKTVGSTDPIGAHPAFRGKGLAKAVTAYAMCELVKRGVSELELGTSSENTAMQRLAESLGFELVRENIWFSKAI